MMYSYQVYQNDGIIAALASSTCQFYKILNINGHALT